MNTKKVLIVLGVVLLIVQALSCFGMSRMYVGLYPDYDDLLYPVFSQERSNLNSNKILFAVEAGFDRFMSGFGDISFDVSEYRDMSAKQITSAMIRESLGCSDGGSSDLKIYDTILALSYYFWGIIGGVFLVTGVISYSISRKKDLEASAPPIHRDDFYRPEA